MLCDEVEESSNRHSAATSSPRLVRCLGIRKDGPSRWISPGHRLRFCAALKHKVLKVREACGALAVNRRSAEYSREAFVLQLPEELGNISKARRIMGHQRGLSIKGVGGENCKTGKKPL